MFCCVGDSVFDWLFCLAIASHHNVAVTTGLVVVCPLGVALCGVELGSLNFRGKGLKVCVDDVGGWQLLVVVLVGDLYSYLLLAFPL